MHTTTDTLSGRYSGLSKADAVEWPSLALFGVIAAGWLGLTFFHNELPTLIVVAGGGWLIAWYASFQHEVIHGHPTRWRSVNRALAFAPLSLWLPFARYRMMHLAHHRDERLTDPLDDPESAYLLPEHWGALGGVARALLAAQTTLLGRLTIGPFWSIGRFLLQEAHLARRDPIIRGIWLRHLLGVSAVLAWVWGVCAMAPWVYALTFVLPGTALLLLRSFAEHRAEGEVAHRTAIVEDAPILGLLYLNNNLHAAHHSRPTMPWYRLGRWYRTHRDELVAYNGGLVYRGYGDVARRYLLSAHDTPPHPLGRAPLGKGPLR